MNHHPPRRRATSPRRRLRRTGAFSVVALGAILGSAQVAGASTLAEPDLVPIGTDPGGVVYADGCYYADYYYSDGSRIYQDDDYLYRCDNGTWRRVY